MADPSILDLLASLGITPGQGGGQPATLPTPAPQGAVPTQSPAPDPDLDKALAMLGIGSSGPAPQPAPAPMAGAPDPAQPPSNVARVSADPVVQRLLAPRNPVGDVVDAFFGGPVAAARRRELQNHLAYLQAVQGAQKADDIRSMPTADRQLAEIAPDAYGKLQQDLRGTHTLTGGQSLLLGNGQNVGTAPVTGFDPVSGHGYSVAGDGTLSTGGAQLPGKQEVTAQGLTNDDRLGPTGTFSLPQTLASGTTPGAFTPVVGGAPTGAPTPSPVAARLLSLASATRGVRNNNPGNIKPSPTGTWQGQTGVDPSGYAVFDTPANGMRAADLNLAAYAHHGITTPAALVNRWASTSSPAEKTAYMGRILTAAGPSFDLSDAKTRATILPAIMQSEGTTALQPASASSGAPASAAPAGWTVGAPSSAQSGPIDVPGLPGKWQRSPEGKLTHLDGTGMTTDDGLKMGKSVLDDPSYRQAQESGAAFNAMIGLAKQKPGGMRAYALRDTFARTINPGAVARSGTIEAIKNSQGIPANLQAYFMNLKGDGDVPPQIVQQILSAAAPFAQSHWDEANALNQHFGGIAKDNGLDPRLATAPLGGRPALPSYRTTPQVGAVEKGFRFRGGDPSQASSWVRAQ